MAHRDGTGPLGDGPMSGRGNGFCILKDEKDSLQGFIGLQGTYINQSKEVTIMPGGNGTGPMGAGPMTGRGAGFCAGFSVPGYMNAAPGRGMGMRGGRGGRGFRNRFNATGLYGWQRAGWAAAAPAAPFQGMTREQELDSLKNQADYLTQSLDEINQRISDMESDKK